MALCDRPAVTLPGSKDQEDHSHDLTVNLSKVSDSFPDMAAGKSSTPSPSFFKILKDGALLPTRNRRLFLAVFALLVAYTSLLLLVDNLAVQPREDEVFPNVMAFSNGTDAMSPDELDELLQDLGKDMGRLVWALAYLLLDVTVSYAIWIVALFAAVATYAGETPCSFAAVLGKARAQLKGTVLTVAFVYGLPYVVLLSSVMAVVLLDLDLDRLFVKVPAGLLFLGWLLVEYFFFICELSVVVAVAEPGRHGASAVGRAWRLLRGRRLRAVLLVAVISALTFVCNRAYGLARTRAVGCPASVVLLGFIYAVAMAAVELFAVCAITAFYYECKESNDASTPDQDQRHDIAVNLSKVSDSFPDMAAVGKSSTPPSTSFFKTLKDAALLPARNRSLFTAVFALAVAYTSLRHLVNYYLTVQPSADEGDELLRDFLAFNNGTGAVSPDEAHKFLRDVAKDTWRHFWPSGARRLLGVTVGNAVWIVSLFAAVATYAGETPCSFAALLGKARAQIKGVAFTVAFAYVLDVAYTVLLLSAMAALLVLDRVFEMGPSWYLFLGWLLIIAAAVFLKYFAFVCELGVVVAVAEPGRHSASAIGRAWRLLRGRKRRAVILVAVTSGLAFGCNRAYALAKTHTVSSHALGLLLKFLFAVVMDVVELFAVCAITAFYYECKERNDDVMTTENGQLDTVHVVLQDPQGRRAPPHPQPEPIHGSVRAHRRLHLAPPPTPCSFAALLGKARAQIKGVAFTVAFAYVLDVAYTVLLLSAMAALLVLDRVFEMGPSWYLFLGWLLIIAAAVFLKYFAFVCELGVVVAVAEPGRHSASAIGRAWRLLRGRKRRAVILVAVTSGLAFGCNRAYALAKTHTVSSHALGLLLKFLFAVVMDVVELFAVCAITAFYYECKERNDDVMTTEYVKLAGEEEVIGA
ncbi:hypothetical protein HU200_009786 [Digitaria exilis]|uniref:Uncharacterized protein n=1 Tax=Digitaria exilis TaxID=1010633 RepID=A0A835FIQ9_9POAL|nr:hypothetical protein HU200_009786 [Digitaria exilis]